MSSKVVHIVVHFDSEYKEPIKLCLPAASTLEDVVESIREVLGDKVLHIVLKPEVYRE